MNYSEVFLKYEDQEWNDNTKFTLLVDFVDRTVIPPTPEMFDDYLADVVVEEESASVAIDKFRKA